MEINHTDNKMDIVYTQDWQQYEYEELRAVFCFAREDTAIKPTLEENTSDDYNDYGKMDICDDTEMEQLLQYYLDQEKKEEEYFQKLEAEYQYEITHCCNCNCEIIPHTSFCGTQCKTEWFQDDFIYRCHK